MTDKNTPNQVLLETFNSRVVQTLDQSRESAVLKRHSKGYQTARQNLALLCEQSSFNEYGQFAVAAQRQRQDYETLKSSTAADGVITGIGEINAELVESEKCQTAVVINDYMVLAGTQGFYHHLKIDRMLAIAKKNKLPVIMYTEGGGGRPGDTDITTVNSGLQCQSFSSWAGLSGVIPRIAVNNGFCFAGNAALFGAADITIATKQSWIGMAGPAMIEGGGLGVYNATEIGPIEVQSKNGVVDIVVEDEVQAAQVAKQCLGYFQGQYSSWKAYSQTSIRQILPDDRRYVYDIRKLINLIADHDTFTELKPIFGGAIITGFIRIEGRPIGLIASDCKVLGGAIDVDAAQKSAEFMRLCNEFSLPMISLCDTPGFMVGPEHEKQGAARKLSQMFVEGAKFTAPLISVVIRKCYGLGAQAMLGGSTSRPDYTISWPTGEFGPMGLEGAVKLGFKKELAEQKDAAARKALFDKLLAKQYQQGQASEVASVLEIDAVIDPLDTRATLIKAFSQFQ
jgi:acetyl-CoA carboxylase carboxyltransferase component